MQWIQTEPEMNRVLEAAYASAGIDSGRLPTESDRFLFDELGIETIEFAKLVLLLLKLSKDPQAAHVVLRPDPIYYFHRELGRYPGFYVGSDDLPEVYLGALGEKLKNGAIDNVGTFWAECVIVPSSQRWFIHAVRTSRDDGGHLWMPREWFDQVSNCYPWLVRSSERVLRS